MGLIFGIVLNFMPHFTVQTVGGIMFIVAFIGAYIIRARFKFDEFIALHMRYIICQIWVLTLLLLIGMVIAVFVADNTQIEMLIRQINDGVYLDNNDLMRGVTAYALENWVLFAFLFVLPPLYALYKLGGGAYAAQKNRLPRRHDKWF